MELEPITRKEKIIAGQDLTPITRMEKFLKQFGGGGGSGLPTGGAPYQQLVTDGDGNAKWEDRLAYEDTVNIIDNQEFVFDNTQMIIGSGDLVVGETYKVIFDSTEYSCECVEMNGVTVIGNVDSSFSDYPFAIGCMSGQITCIVQNPGTYTIGVIGKSVNRIPEKFLPTFAKTKTIFFNATDEELNAAYEHYKNGGVLYLAGRLVLYVQGSLDVNGISFTVYNKIYTFTGGGQHTETDIV